MPNNISFKLRAAIALILIPVLTGCVGSSQWYATSGSVWGTTYHIKYESAQNLDDSIVIVTNRIGESLSMFSPSSTVSRINANMTDSIDEYFNDVYEISRLVSEASGGHFDPTVAPLCDIWGFGRPDWGAALPDSTVIADILRRVGIFRTDVRGNRLIKQNPLIEFDFSAIAKGYGVDKVAEMLRRNGCHNYMVEIGGEIALSGTNPNQKKWKIQIDAPVIDSAPGDSSLMVMDLTDCAVATSGNYRNHREIGSRDVGHTIDPLTGQPAVCSISSATVIAPACAVADALATALMASPEEYFPKIIGLFPDVSAIVVLASGEVVEINETP